APERVLEPGEGRLGAVRRVPERRLAAAGRPRLRLAAGPALEQAAERERRRLACAELADEPLGRRVLHGVLHQDLRPAGLVADPAHPFAPDAAAEHDCARRGATSRTCPGRLAGLTAQPATTTGRTVGRRP